MIVPEWSLKNMKFGGIFNSSALPASLQLREAATEEDHENRSWKLIPLSYPRAGQQKKKKTATKKQENSHYAIMLLSYIQNHYAGQFWKSPKKVTIICEKKGSFTSVSIIARAFLLPATLFAGPDSGTPWDR